MKRKPSAAGVSSGRFAVTGPLLRRLICAALLLFAVVLSWRTAWVVSTTLLDSDASSNLVLGAKLAREGGIFSKTFTYATELYVADIQIVYSLLFRLCGDWSLVRFLGAVILQCLMLWAYAYLARKARMSFNAFCVTAAAMLLPFSVPYGRIVLYHNYYIPHITLDLWMVGLYLSASHGMDAWRLARKNGFPPAEKVIPGLRRKHPGFRDRMNPRLRSLLSFLIPSLLLGLVAFVAGLAGVRQLMICAAPLLVAAFLSSLLEERADADRGPVSLSAARWPALLLALAMVLCCALGYLVNSRVLAAEYTFSSYSDQTLSLVSVSGLETIFRGLLTAIGYQENISLFTLHGMLSVGCVAAMLIAVILAFHTLRHTRNHASRFLQLFWLIDLLVITCVFAFLAAGEFTYELYYLPVIVWMLPALGSADLRAPRGALYLPSEPASKETFTQPSGAPTLGARLLGLGSPKMSVHGLIALAACLLLIASGTYYSCFFRNPADYASEVDYSGLRVHDPFTVEGLQPVADYMKKEGYTLCYATYWDGAVLTELTDGQVSAVSVEPGSRRKVIQYQQWLTDTLLWDPEYIKDRKACILAGYDLAASLEGESKIMDYAVARETIGGYTIYELTDPTVIARYLD